MLCAVSRHKVNGVPTRPMACRCSVLEPPEFAVRAAQDVLAALPQMPVYARVDGTLVGDTFLLNELELIEPALYLHTSEGATERFARVLAQLLGQHSST